MSSEEKTVAQTANEILAAIELIRKAEQHDETPDVITEIFGYARTNKDVGHGPKT